jgi:hypothetical protein
MNININELYKEVVRENDIYSELDIQNILNSVDNENNDYLINKTLYTVAEDIYDSLELKKIQEEEKKK